MVTKIMLGKIEAEVVLKDIKNVHLSVHPPAGRVRIAAPKRMNLDTIRVFAISKLDWIKIPNSIKYFDSSFPISFPDNSLLPDPQWIAKFD
jgi:hypothetical protein